MHAPERHLPAFSGGCSVWKGVQVNREWIVSYDDAGLFDFERIHSLRASRLFQAIRANAPAPDTKILARVTTFVAALEQEMGVLGTRLARGSVLHYNQNNQRECSRQLRSRERIFWRRVPCKEDQTRSEARGVSLPDNSDSRS